MNTPDRIIRLPEVIQIVGLSRSTIYKAISENNFPQPTKLSPRVIGWSEKTIQQWIHQKINADQK